MSRSTHYILSTRWGLEQGSMEMERTLTLAALSRMAQDPCRALNGLLQRVQLT